MTYVVDASVAVEYLLRTPLGLRAATLLDGAMLMAPELLDVEVVSAGRDTHQTATGFREAFQVPPGTLTEPAPDASWLTGHWPAISPGA
jgi:predicted nucleic acid-binding protein